MVHELSVLQRVLQSVVQLVDTCHKAPLEGGSRHADHARGKSSEVADVTTTYLCIVNAWLRSGVGRAEVAARDEEFVLSLFTCLQVMVM